MPTVRTATGRTSCCQKLHKLAALRSPPGHEMEITFLGTGAGSFQGSRRHPAAVFVEGVLLDCGAGTTGRLEDLGLFNRVDAVAITHLHTDHVAGLFDFLLHTVIAKRQRPLTVLSPPGLSPILASLNAVDAFAVNPAKVYELRVVEGALPTARVGPWTVESVALEHSVYNVGYHLASTETSVFYTGDTREPSAAADRHADVLIHESTYADRNATVAHTLGHSTSSQAARAAMQMRARRLFLTHLASQPGTEAEVRSEARAIFPDAELAEECRRYEL